MQLIRSFLFFGFLVAVTLAFGVLAAPLLLFGENTARWVCKRWVQLVLAGLQIIAGISYRVIGKENIPHTGAIVASNHQSMWETMALYALLPRPVTVFKKELLRVPVYGWFSARAGNIAVDRDGGAKTLRKLRKDVAKCIEDGCQVIFFPEGTRAPPGEIIPFKPGIAGVYAATNAPCVPVAHDSGRYWRTPGPKKIRGEISIEFLPPIEAGLDRKVFSKTLENQILKARPDLKNQDTHQATN